MPTEQNVQVQIGEFWFIPFTSDAELSLSGARLEFAASQDDVRAILLSTDTSPSFDSPYNSPFNSPFTSPPSSPEMFSPFTIDSPAVSGTVTVEPDDQIKMSPGSWNYEIRAQFANGVYTTLTYGRIIVQPSLFAWPVS